MISFVHPQTFQIREWNAGIAREGHLLTVIQTLERNVLRLRSGVCYLDESGQRKANPRHHHGPALDTPMAVDPLFKWGDFQNCIEIKHSGTLDRSLDGHRPGRSAEVFCVLSGISFS